MGFVADKESRPQDLARNLPYAPLDVKMQRRCSPTSAPFAGETEFFVLEPDEFPATEELERQWVQEHLDHPGKIDLLAEAAGTIIGNLNFENGPHWRIAHQGVLELPS